MREREKREASGGGERKESLRGEGRRQGAPGSASLLASLAGYYNPPPIPLPRPRPSSILGARGFRSRNVGGRILQSNIMSICVVLMGEGVRCEVGRWSF